jgi:hypothetical protein
MVARTRSFLAVKAHQRRGMHRGHRNALLPLLRIQPSCQDEMACIVPGGTEAVSVHVWDNKSMEKPLSAAPLPPS